MYAILNSGDQVSAVEERSNPLSEFVRPEFQSAYVKLTTEEEQFVTAGYQYVRESKLWIAPDPIEPAPEVVEEAQPTNAQIAQMISDLQADLLIAGVI